MQADRDVDRVLARLPDGRLVLSTLLTDPMPLGHVYRVMSPSGTILNEFSTLGELTASLDHPPTAP